MLCHRRDILPLAVCLLGLPGAALAGEIVDYLSVPGPLEFAGATYYLARSSHPSTAYYKQEYLPPGQPAERYRQMLLLEAITNGVDVNGAARVKAADLNARKQSDPAASFALARNPKTGEVILDFIVSKDIDKDDATVEWNAYRYAPLKGAGGSDGVLLFGLSRRAYGDDATAFLRGIKAARPAEIAALAGYKMPMVKPRR